MSSVRDVRVDVGRRTVAPSSLDRVLWPVTGTTKADLVRYCSATAGAVLLAHVRGHPVTLHRFPEGVDGTSFFQTRAPAHPPWVRAVTLRTPRAGKVFDVVVLDEPAGSRTSSERLEVRAQQRLEDGTPSCS